MAVENSAESCIRADSLTCGYGKKAILSNVSFEVKASDVFCILGPNGVGKTTLFKTVLGFLPRMAGTFLVNGRDILDYKREDLARIVAYVPQAHVPPFPFTVEDIVLMGRSVRFGRRRSPSAEDMRIAGELLDSLGIAHLAPRIYTEISGGERQMVLIARALAQEPDFLVMDEPASNLDYGNQSRVMQQIVSLSERGIGIVMASHHPDHAFLCRSNVILLDREGGMKVGYCDDVLTDENLSKAYGINVKILTGIDSRGNEVKSCALCPA